MRYRFSKSGFTFVEILLVLVLIGVFTGLIIPRVGGLFFGYEFHATVNQVEKLIRSSQERAILDNRIYRLSIDAGKKSVRVDVRSVKEEEAEDFVMLDESGKHEISVPEGITMRMMGIDVVFFYPDGTSDKTKFILAQNEDRKATFSIGKTIHAFKVKYD